MRWIAFLVAFLVWFGGMWVMALRYDERIDIRALQYPTPVFYKLYRPRLIPKKKTLPTRPKKHQIPEKISHEKIPKKEKLAKKISPSVKSDQQPSRHVTTQPPPRVVDISELSESLRMIEPIYPHYPELARKAGIECKLLVEMIIDEDGRVATASVVQCSRPGYYFERHALDAVTRLRFYPVSIQGRAVRVKIVYPIDFVLVE